MPIFYPSIKKPQGRNSTASALIITLSILVLVAILIVSLFSIVRLERLSASSSFETLQAKTLANMGVDNAVALIREATTLGSANGKLWASQPGKITVFNADGTEDTGSSRFLFSKNTTSFSVNLNQRDFSGLPPIASAASVDAATAPDMQVSWVNVLQDPTSTASSTNKLMGRYAFWVDDETAKINLNTADGTGKYGNNSFGTGTPTEVALCALKSGGMGVSGDVAKGIATQSGALYSSTASRPFNASVEIQQVAGVPSQVVQENNFCITHYNRAPELNIFGEPRIALVTSDTNASGYKLNAMTGAYGSLYNSRLNSMGLPSNSLYPLSSQLPSFTAPGVTTSLPQYFQAEYDPISGHPPVGNGFSSSNIDYAMGMRIARYLKGYNSSGDNIKWPVFIGSGTNGFGGKYTDRQIDSIALQILTLMKKGVFADHIRSYAIPYVMPKGFISGKPVCGLSRAPRVNEIVIKITTANGSPPTFNMQIWIEWYFPKEFTGSNILADNLSGWNYGNAPNYANVINGQDAPSFASTSAAVTAPSPLGGYWMDNMIQVLDQSGDSAGVDFCGNRNTVLDPDSRSATYHPSANGYGTGPRADIVFPILQMYTLNKANVDWTPGEYRSSCNWGVNSYYPMKPGTTSITLKGGLAIGAHTETNNSYGGGYSIDPVPLDSMRGPYTGESLGDATIRQAVLDAVIPLPHVTVPVPGTVTIHMQVADPLVNKFPGDWVVTVNPPDSEITMKQVATNQPTIYTDGQNTIAKPDATNHSDPQTIWWPPQMTSIPKSQRFPSVGYLQYIRTGLFPDKENDSKPLAEQKGTPYRALNFSPSSDASQTTAGGDSYPDWAMLDLFTVPAVLQPLASPNPAPLRFTWGGATAGKLNPNATCLPFSSVSRLTPLQSVFKGIQASTSYDLSGSPVTTTVDEVALATAVKQYVTNLGRPLMMPGEICNVPEVAAYLYKDGNASSKSRNDLVRQIVGNLTTRSNTFSIWAIGQVVKKIPGHQQYGAYETGDAIIGESKMQILVERVLDYGADGVPGNTQNQGADGVVGTPDDPIDSVYHPSFTYPLPYKYRVISAREVIN